MGLKNVLRIIFCVAILYGAVLKGQQDNNKFSHLTTENGLSDNHVQTILKDRKGFIWIGTASGLNRYDGFEFKVFKREPFDTTSLADNSINAIYEDLSGKLLVQTSVGYCIFNPETETFNRNQNYQLKGVSFNLSGLRSIFRDKTGNFWYITNSNGIYRQNRTSDSVKHFVTVRDDSTTIENSPISGMQQDSSGNYWIIHFDGVLEKMDKETDKITFRTRFLNEKSGPLNLFFRIFCDSRDELWIYSNTTSMEIACYNPAKNSVDYIGAESGYIKTNTDLISSIIEDDKGNIWVGTDHGGINIINKKKKEITYVVTKRDDPKSISQNSITFLYRDNDNIIWVGTYKQGVNIYHSNLFNFKDYKNIPTDPNSLNYNDINCFCEDGKGNLLIGTNGGGINYFDRKQNKFTTLKHNPDNSNSLSNDVVVSMLKDSQNNIWIGTYYGGLDKYDGKNFTTYVNNPDNPRSLADNRVWDIYEDSRKNLWIGTLSGGIDLFDRTHNVFLHYSGNDQSLVRSNYIFAICEDFTGYLWVGTSDGIYIIKWNTGKVSYLNHSEHDNKTLSNNNVTCLLQDSRNLMWVGTRDGLNLYNRAEKSFIKFRTENGLPDNTIQGILEDDRGNLWISTSNGISMMSLKIDSPGNITSYNFINYDEKNGLQGRSFNEGAAYKTSRGELLFGGANGFNMFTPSKVSHVNFNAPVFIVGFDLLGTKLTVNDSNFSRPILTKSIINTDKIILKHKENVFTIEFAALAYIEPERIKYRYRLEGFNNNWLYTDNSNRKATFTNLDPGRYKFVVEAYQDGDDNNKNQAQLSIIVKPPYWRTKLAFLIYFLLFAGLLLLFRQLLLFKAHLQFQNQQAIMETRRQHELNAIKTRFFTNISHEFRTPLTLILTPLERIIRKPDQTDVQPALKLVYQNARRLLNLVNQLLDFRKMEEQRLSINPDYGNIIKFINEIFKSFSDLAETKKIEYSYHPGLEQLFMRFDEDKLEKILFNLLSNAFKFTQNEGKISISVGLIDKNAENNPLASGFDTVVIKIKDSGIGIPPEKQELVFERFFQNDLPPGTINKGSGIGLSLTKEFVKLHNGTITLESKPEKGSTFAVYLPVNRERIEDINKQRETATLMQDGALFSENTQQPDRSDVTLLLVEDNEDFRFYLRDNLKVRYNIKEAQNGKEAWEMIQLNLPDLIVCDLLMPEMNGLELCSKVKQDKNTSHIPFLLLTASLTGEFKLEAFQLGADSYLTKPFSFELLESRIKTLVTQRELSKKRYQKNFKIEPGTIGITSLDEKLMAKALKIVEDNINDTEFSVERLSHELGFSRVHLYKKLLSITGKSPVEFIRLVRLKRAAQLLKESQLTVSEIAYQVGFNDPRYFSKQFKAEFQMLPSKFKLENNADDNNQA